MTRRQKRLLSLPAIGFAVVLAGPVRLSAAEPSPLAEALRERAERHVAEGAAPGIAVALVEGGHPTLVSGFGRTGAGRVMGSATRMSLGSVSKTFVGLAILLLEEEGRLSLEDVVSEHIEGLALGGGQSVTIRQLLNHTSGLTRLVGNVNQHATRQDDAALADSVDELSSAPLAHTPGEVHEYSNANYRILGRIVEKVTGLAFSDAMETLIFEPLGMAATSVGHHYGTTDALGHRYWLTRTVAFDEPMGRALNPQGGVSSTAEDMARYLVSLTGGSEAIPDSYSPRLAETSYPTENQERYGAGWTVLGEPGQPLLRHYGSNPGWSAALVFSPSQALGMAVMVNAGDGFVTGDIAYLMDDLLAVAFPEIVPEPIAYGWRWAQLLVASALALLLWCTAALKLARWRTAPLRPVPEVLLFLLVAGFWAAMVWLLPRAFGIPLVGIRLFAPDAGWALTACAWGAFLHGLLRGAFLASRLPRHLRQREASRSAA